jgi:hypothetical protein
MQVTCRNQVDGGEVASSMTNSRNNNTKDDSTQSNESNSNSNKRMKHLLPHIIDAFLAGLTAILGLCLLHIGEYMLHIKLYDAKMLTSIVIFCSNPVPPSPRSFVICTVCAYAVAILLQWSSHPTSTELYQAIAVGLNVVLSKLTSHTFSPAIGICAIVATKKWQQPILDPIKHLVTPWLLGHGIIYCFVWCMSKPRRYIRVQLAIREWRLSSIQQQQHQQQQQHHGKNDDDTNTNNEWYSYSEAQLQESFTRGDTSGDGRIDAVEFKIAYRHLTGSIDDLSLADCMDIVRTLDIDGNGSIDFVEFCQAVQPYYRQRGGGSTFKSKQK